MANTKTKIELRDKNFSLTEELNHYWDWSWYFDWDSYEYCWGGCSCHACSQVEYEYLPQEESNLIYRSGRSGLHFAHTPRFGRMIDMTTIYSKEVLREKKIDAVLGLSDEFKKITFEDIWKK
jgi:hypothetical protein